MGHKFPLSIRATAGSARNREAHPVMVVVQRYADHMAAEFDRAVLEANGIHGLIVTDDAGGMLPFPTLSVIRLMVHEDDVERAVAALGLEPDSREDDEISSPAE